MRTQPTFSEQGSFEKPGIVGRLVRIALGVLCLFGVRNLVVDGHDLVENSVTNKFGWLIMIGLALWLTWYKVLSIQIIAPTMRAAP